MADLAAAYLLLLDRAEEAEGEMVGGFTEAGEGAVGISRQRGHRWWRVGVNREMRERGKENGGERRR